jgi:glutamate-1-semialdehyde 2,1-aminomutase
MSYKNRLLKSIPGGAHTYSRGNDQYPENTPQILERAKDAYTYDINGNRFLDYGMGLRAVNIGYANEQINNAVIKQINFGNTLTRASVIELKAAELLVGLIDSVDMVKFTKNGSTAVSAAVKLSRAHTGRDLVARCAEQPFFSYDDWFIGSTPLTLGIPQDTIDKTKTFSYNDIGSLEALISKYPNQIACVILEPSSTECPAVDGKKSGCCGKAVCERDYRKAGKNYLQEVQELCHKHGIVFVLDEMITGFRWHIKGAQYLYNVKPDLCTFGKAMANGFSVACIAGRREIMELGSIEHMGRERLFLLSTTHGAEMSGMGAFVATVNYMQNHKVVDHLWVYGQKLIQLMNGLAKKFNIEKNFIAAGVSCSPYYLTLDRNGKNCLGLRTLFAQEMIKNGVLIPCIAISFSHGEKELELTKNALEKTFEVYRKAIDFGFEQYLIGDVIKPVFRKYN